jgi:hypothetical protein
MQVAVGMISNLRNEKWKGHKIHFSSKLIYITFVLHCIQQHMHVHQLPLKLQLSHYCHADDKQKRRYSSYSFLTLALDWGEWSVSRLGRTLPLGKELWWLGGSVGLRAGLDIDTRAEVQKTVGQARPGEGGTVGPFGEVHVVFMRDIFILNEIWAQDKDIYFDKHLASLKYEVCYIL